MSALELSSTVDTEKNEFIFVNENNTMINIYPLQQMRIGRYPDILDQWYKEISPHIASIEKNDYVIYDGEIGKLVPYNDENLKRKIRLEGYRIIVGERVDCVSSAEFTRLQLNTEINDKKVPLGQILTEQFPYDPEVGVTHTIIPSKSRNTKHVGEYTFSVSPGRFPEFMHIMKSLNRRLFCDWDSQRQTTFPALTQRRQEFCSLTIDIDLKYEGLRKPRLFTLEMISRVNKIIVDALMDDMVSDGDGNRLNFECFKLYRDHPYNDIKENITKDGFHLEYPYIVQTVEYWKYFYTRVCSAIDSVFRGISGLVNEKPVYDGVSVTGNWLCYMSAKPGKYPMTVRGDTMNAGRKILREREWELKTDAEKNSGRFVCELDLVEILSISYGKKPCILKHGINLPIAARNFYGKKDDLQRQIDSANESLNTIIGMLKIISQGHLSHLEWTRVSFGLFTYARAKIDELSDEETDTLRDEYIDMSVAVNDSEEYVSKALAMWTTHVDVNTEITTDRPCTVATLRHFAIKTNETEYLKLIGNDETITWPSVQPADIDYFTTARFDASELTVYNSRYVRPLDLAEFDTALIQSHVNTGKTTGVIDMIKRNPDKNAILITFRITLAEKLFGDLIDVGFEIYNEVRGSLNKNKMIVQVDSLRRLETFNWDIVILDEINLLLAHLESPLMKNYSDVIANLNSVTCGAGKLIGMDAYMTPRVAKFIKTIERRERIKIVDTEFGPETVIVPNTLRVYKNEYIPEEQMRNVYFSPNKETMIQKIKVDVRAGKKICIVSMSKKFANTLAEICTSVGARDVVVYTGDTIKYNRATLRDVETNWKGKQVVIFTQTIVAGVSYNGAERFDKIYMYCVPETGTWDTVIQMLNRVRDVSEREMVICVEGGKFIPRHSDYLFSTARIEENILAKINTQENMMAKYVFNNMSYGTRRDSFTFDVTKNWVYWVCIENQRHNLFSRRYFKDIITRKLQDLNCKIHDLPSISDVEIEDMKIEYSEMNKNYRDRENSNIINSGEITDETYHEIGKKIQSGQQITEEETNSHRKKFLREIYKFDGVFDMEDHAKFLDNTEIRRFTNRCNFHVDKEDIPKYITEIDKMAKTNEFGIYVESSEAKNITGGAKFCENILKNGDFETERKIFEVEKHILIDYSMRGKEFNILAIENSDNQFIIFLITLVHMLGFTVNGTCDVAQPRFAAAKTRIIRNIQFFRQYCGGKKYPIETIEKMTDREFMRWLNYSLKNRLSFTIKYEKKMDVWYKHSDKIPFKYYSKNNILAKTQEVEIADAF